MECALRYFIFDFQMESDVQMRRSIHYRVAINIACKGFTLLEVMVALAIVGTALGASLRAVGSLTQNSSDLRVSMMANWSAENRLSQIRLAQEWPALGQRRFNCAQGELQLICEENVFATPNPFFRRVEVSVFDMQNTTNAPNAGRRIIKLAQVVPNAQ